jgi:hypothetical protein
MVSAVEYSDSFDAIAGLKIGVEFAIWHSYNDI